MKYDGSKRVRVNTKDLSQDDVKLLLNSLKFPKKVWGLQEIWDTLTKLELDPINNSTEFIDEDNGILYILHIRRGRIADRYSIHLRFKENNIHLARVDINPPKHENPDRTVLERGKHHIHIYTNAYKKRDSVAYLLSPSEFPNVTNIIEVFESFIKKVNIEERTG